MRDVDNCEFCGEPFQLMKITCMDCKKIGCNDCVKPLANARCYEDWKKSKGIVV